MEVTYCGRCWTRGRVWWGNVLGPERQCARPWGANSYPWRTERNYIGSPCLGVLRLESQI